ncbi:uncharacterized protein LOC110829633 [Zootermopsis nevadensis]|uniref:uncharacterized protein LOC110829633 n=1 Tax=Zootermopsis nevadensis TaxID=136037 RepID=UPI000B8EA91F|nr:uncharacterized protein LOC110829633 [Zootermopsis nevadensis]
MIQSLFIIIGLMFWPTTSINLGELLGCEKDITVDYMEQCPEETNMAVSFTDLSIQQINKDQCAFNGKIEFLKPVGEPWKLTFRLRKCKSKDNSKSCQDFFNFNMDKICEKLHQKNQVWSGFLEEIEMDKKCPLQPKVYPIKNIVIDADAMKYFPINNAYFKLRIEGYMNVTKILCVDSAFTLSCKK